MKDTKSALVLGLACSPISALPAKRPLVPAFGSIWFIEHAVTTHLETDELFLPFWFSYSPLHTITSVQPFSVTAFIMFAGDVVSISELTLVSYISQRFGDIQCLYLTRMEVLAKMYIQCLHSSCSKYAPMYCRDVKETNGNFLLQ